SGSWSNPSTWGGSVPTANHIVRIVQGHLVTIDDQSAVAYTIAVDGKLRFAPTVNTRLKMTNLQVMAGSMGMGTPGILEVGTAAAPIAANVTRSSSQTRRSAAVSRTRINSEPESPPSEKSRCTA